MPTNSTNYGLHLYDKVTDANQKFIDYRDSQNGSGSTSNMNIIDTTMKGINDSVTNLAGTGRTTETVKGNTDLINTVKADVIYKANATMSSANTYSATITGITVYATGLGILLTVPTTSTGTSTLTINSLTTQQLVKINSLGNMIQLEANDLYKNKPTLFVYNGSAFVAVDSGSADQINFIDSTFSAKNVKDALLESGSEILESTGYGVISGLITSAQVTPNMTVNVATGIVHMANGVRLAPVANTALAINAADTTKPRTDIVYVNSNGVITYLAGALGTVAIAGARAYTITTNCVATDTITIGGVVFTAIASGATGNQFNIGADTTITATNLTSVLNANATISALYTATSSTNIITLTEKVSGGGNTPAVATYTGTVVVSSGTAITSAVASSTAPTTPTDGFLLSQISVNANATTIVIANITDKRKIKNTTDTNMNEIGSLSTTVSEHLLDNMSYLVNVKYPPLGYTSAKGDGVTDDTVAINAIVQYIKTNKLGGLYFPQSTGSYMINGTGASPLGYIDGGIIIDSSMQIVLHPNATLQCITGTKQGYSIINVQNTSNVLVQGGNIVGDRTTHGATGGEFGFGIGVYHCKNVKIRDVIITDCWGDGICLYSIDVAKYNEDIWIDNVITRNNRRQGMSIVSGIRVYVDGSEFSNTNGTPPQSGIDIESDTGFTIPQDIFISNCKFNNNTSFDICMGSNAKNVEITNNVLSGCNSISIDVGAGVTVEGLVVDGNIISMGISGVHGIYSSGVISGAIINENIITNMPTTDGVAIGLGAASIGVTISNNNLSMCSYGIFFNGASSSHISINNNKIHDVRSHGIYPIVALLDSDIINNDFYGLATHGIFARMTNCLISNNTFKDAQNSGITDIPSKCTISNNIFIDMGKGNYASAWASIDFTGVTADNFVFGNRVRNAITGHIGIRDSGTPTTPNIVSKNDLRYAVAAQVLSLNAADINDGNFTL